MDLLFTSTRMYLGEGDNFVYGGVLVSNTGMIRRVLTTKSEVNSFIYNNEVDVVYDFKNKILMPGLIDTNVHINEPGRKDWEGFLTATKAAAAGGFTTLVDMPLNSIPPTTTVDNLKAKISTARGKLYVDLALWGGIVPENINDLESLLDCGVIGLKCSMCPSGVPEFGHVNKEQIENAIKKIAKLQTVIAFHAEICPPQPIQPDASQPKKYETFLKTRPASMEINAVKTIAELAEKYKTPMHITNLSTAEAVPIIQKCKGNGGKLTVETCHHYLTIASEDIPDSRTEFKCCPPIREKSNQDNLWKAVINQDIDLIVSDHSPTTPGMKCLTYGKGRGDFIKAWAGISSQQFGLSLFWTNCCKYGLKISDVYRLMCKNPAKLCGLDNSKGKIAEGYDADFCIWDPDEEFTLTSDIVFSQNKANPYMNQKLRGVVYATVVRGLHVFERYESFGQPLGRVILRRASKKIVKFT